jgi:hypothetical protein
MKINIETLNRDCFNLEVEPNYTIELVKLKIEDKKGFPPDNIILMNKVWKLENEKSLDDYYIEDGDTIKCIPKMRGHDYIPIYIRTEYKITEINICLCYKINNLKEVIFEKLFYKPEYQKIIFNGKLLDKEVIDLRSLGIKKDSILDLKLKYYNNYDDVIDYKKKYEESIYKLTEMGFKENEIDIKLLKNLNGDIQYYFVNKDFEK